MRKRAGGISSALFAVLVAIPGSAPASPANGSDCTYTTTGGPNAGVQAGPGGMTGTASFAVGACVNTASGDGFEGGSVETGVGNGTQAYAVTDGDNQNFDPLDGYAGLSNYETGTASDTDCSNGPDQGQAGTSNSGGCFGLDGGPWVDLGSLPVPTPICGNTSGNTWNTTTRDGGEHSCFLDSF